MGFVDWLLGRPTNALPMKSFLRVMVIPLLGCVGCAFQARVGDEESAKGVAGTWHGALITDYVGSPPLPLTHLRAPLYK